MNSEVKPAVLNELSEQTLRLKRQLMALSVAFIYSSIVVYLYLKGHFRYDTATFVYALVLFWVGNLGITLLIYKGISQKLSRSKHDHGTDVMGRGIFANWCLYLQ